MIAAHDENLIGDIVTITPRLAMAYSAGLLLDQDRYYGVNGDDPPVLPFLWLQQRRAGARRPRRAGH